MGREILADATTPAIVARYMTRRPITPERMLGGASSAQVIYRPDAVHPHHQANFRSAELTTKPPLDNLPASDLVMASRERGRPGAPRPSAQAPRGCEALLDTSVRW